MSPLVTNCTIYNENRNWVIIGDKQSVEDCKCQLMALIQFLEMRLKASGTNKVTKTKFLIKERVCIILESKKLDKFRGHNDTLKVDFAEDFEHIKFYGDMQAIESVMQELHTYLQTVQGSVYNCSRLIRRWLNNIKGTSNLKELLRSHGLVSSWRIEEDTCIVYGSSLEDVRSVKKIFDRVLVSEILKLSDAQNELMHSEIGRAEIIDETKRYEGFLEIKIADHEVEIACLLQIEEVRSRLREFLIQHEVIKTAQKVDNGLFKLLQQYHYDKLALMQQRCKTILVEVNTFEERAKCGFVLTGRREVCMKAVRELENLLATIPSFKLTIKGVGLASFLQSEEGRDQIATFESKHRCIVNFANGIPDSQDKVRDCQYDDNKPLVLNDEIGLAGQISVKETRSRVDGKYMYIYLHIM